MLPAVPAADAASRTWTVYDKATTKAAADRAGVPAGMDADIRLRTIRWSGRRFVITLRLRRAQIPRAGSGLGG